MYKEKQLIPLFIAVREFVRAAGGDGDGYIISKNYLQYANEFEVWEQNNGRWFVERDTNDGFVAFLHNQEAIIFASDLSKLPQCGSDYIGDIVVRVR